MVKKAKKPNLSVNAVKSAGGSLAGDKKRKQLHAAMLQRRLPVERRVLLAPRRGSGNSSAGADREAIAAGCTSDLRAGDAIALSRHDSPHDLRRGSSHDSQRGSSHNWIVDFVRGASPRLQPEIPQSEIRKPGTRSRTLERRKLDSDALAANATRMKNANKKAGNVILAFSGDGSSSLLRWREILKLAGTHALPIIFVQWNELPGESTGIEPQTKQRTKTPTQRQSSGLETIDCGFPTIPVDRHDMVAVYRVAYEAIHRARQGGGPTLIDCKAYVPDAVPARRPSRSFNRPCN